MQRTKPVTFSAQFLPGRDDEAINFLKQPHIKPSAVLRLGVKLYMDKVRQGGNIVIEIDEAEEVEPPQPKTAGGNPFLSASP